MTNKVAAAGWRGLVRRRLWYVRDLVIAADPALIRLRMALRSAATVVGGTALLALGPSSLRPNTAVMLVAVLIAMLGAVVVSDPTRRAEQITTALLPVVAIAAVGVAATVGPGVVESTTVFCAAIFIAVFVRRFGPRGSALGTLFFMGYFFALYLQIQRSDLPQAAGSIAVTMGVAFVVRFWIVPERPQPVVVATVRAFRARASIICDDLASLILEDRVPRRERRLDRVRRQLVGLNEAALAVDDQISVTAQSIAHASAEARSHAATLLEVELGIETLADGFRHLVESDTSPADRTTLAQLAMSLRPMLWYRAQPSPAAGEGVLALLNGESAQSTWWAHVAWAARILGQPRSWQAPAATGERARGLPGSGGASTPVQPAAGDKLSPTLRLAIQATVAGLLAQVAGRLISPQRWYWAVIAAFVVFLRGTTRGEMVSRAGQRIVGTIAGVVGGLMMADLAGRDPHLALALVFVGVFLTYYFLWLSYAWTVFFLTTVLALLYTVLGRFSPELLVLRLAETVVGAAIAAGVAAVLFPARTGHKLRTLLAGVLRNAAVAIATATARPDVATASSETALIRARELDRALQTLWQATASLTVSNRPATAPRLPGAPLSVHEESVIAYCTRHLAWIASTASADDWSPDDGARGERIAAVCSSLAEALEKNKRVPASDPSVPIETPAADNVWTIEDMGSASPWLTRIEQTVRGVRDPSGVPDEAG